MIASEYNGRNHPSQEGRHLVDDIARRAQSMWLNDARMSHPSGREAHRTETDSLFPDPTHLNRSAGQDASCSWSWQR